MPYNILQCWQKLHDNIYRYIYSIGKLFIFSNGNFREFFGGRGGFFNVKTGIPGGLARLSVSHSL